MEQMLMVESVKGMPNALAARAARIAMGVPHKKRRGHMDELAATYILQTYLDAQN